MFASEEKSQLPAEEKLFDKFYDTYKHKVYHFLLLYVKVPEIAEELTIDVFVKLWKNETPLHRIEDADAFLFIACKRKALDFLRAAQRDKKLQSRVAHELLQPLSASGAEEQFENKDILHHALRLLPEKRRRIFVLNRLQGFSYEEIAVELNISIHTVRNTLVATTRQLKKFVLSSHQFDLLWLPVLFEIIFLFQ